jgi:hypothetical protein
MATKIETLNVYPKVSAFDNVASPYFQVAYDNPDYNQEAPLNVKTNFPTISVSVNMAAFAEAQPEAYAAYQTWLAGIEAFLQINQAPNS